MAKTHRTRFIPLLLGLVLAATSCGGDDDATAATTATGDTALATTTTQASPTITEVPLSVPAQPAADYAGFRALPTACGADQPAERVEMQFAAPDDLGLDATAALTAVISTSCGDIVVELDPSAAPATVNSFAFLAESGYFDGTVSHRVVPGFMMQAGDPTGTGIGGPGFTLPDEFPPSDFVYARGVVAMANAGPGTSGSQFFIMQSDAPLPPQYTAFGRVVEGIEVLDSIAALPLGVGPSGELSSPLEALYLNSVTINR